MQVQMLPRRTHGCHLFSVAIGRVSSAGRDCEPAAQYRVYRSHPFVPPSHSGSQGLDAGNGLTLRMYCTALHLAMASSCCAQCPSSGLPCFA
jgi:hypothetical protein